MIQIFLCSIIENGILYWDWNNIPLFHYQMWENSRDSHIIPMLRFQTYPYVTFTEDGILPYDSKNIPMFYFYRLNTALWFNEYS